jgi:cytochrome c oxidase subunit II
MSPSPTLHAQSVDLVMVYIVAVSVILLLGITAVMIYFVFKYHRKHGHEPVNIEENHLLEITWIVIPTLLVLSMFYFGYNSFRETRDIPKDSFVVEVTARMWHFSFKYPNGKATDTLYVPVDKPVKLVMESVDVNHAFFIPAFRIKEDIMHGKKTLLPFTAKAVGEYDIACAEYCGLNHSAMYTKVKVIPQNSFASWYEPKAEINKAAVAGK